MRSSKKTHSVNAIHRGADAYLLDRALPLIKLNPRAPFLDRTGDRSLRTEKANYDFDDPTQRTKISAVMRMALMMSNRGVWPRQNNGYIARSFIPETEAISGIEIQRADVPPFADSFTDWRFVKRLQDALGAGGIALPKTWVPSDSPRYDANTATAHYDQKKPLGVIFDFLKTDQSLFDEFKKVAENRPVGAEANLSAIGVNPNASLEDLYAQVGEAYFFKGIQMERNLNWLRGAKLPAELGYMEAMAQVFQERFKQGFHYDVLPASFQEYAPGDIVALQDINPDEPDQFLVLRPGPTYRRPTDHYTQIKFGEAVELLEPPIMVGNNSDRQAVQLWKIATDHIRKEAPQYNVVINPNAPKRVGWVARESLGWKY